MRKLFRRLATVLEVAKDVPTVPRASGTPSHPERPNLRGDLARIRAAGRRLAFWFSPVEPGYTILMMQAKREVRDAIRAGAMSIDHVAGADHTFSNLGPRRALIGRLREHFCNRYPSRERVMCPADPGER